jgi:eukaryotic-like serine/threonine-protein kinase
VASENRIGEVLASKYRLLELLGSGGMGHVYRAVNEHVGRTVAIKVLRREHAENEQLAERFLREARAANLVRHPNVVDVLDIGKEDGGAPFIVQELLEGEDLAHFVARRGGKLPVDEVCDLLLPVIDAVAEAHAKGVVHRDIKPENVFLVRGVRAPTPKLLDFGISKVRASDLRVTEVGMMMGTPAYMAPEQVQGSRDADPRADVWALGVMMFELIAGRMPFDEQDAPALFFAIATKDAPTLLDVHAEVTPAVSRVVERCLRRVPEGRYPSAAELGRDLRHVLDGSELEATGKRSLPPGLGHVVPDLAIPSAARTPSFSREDGVDGRAKTEVGVATSPSDRAPSLPPPPALATAVSSSAQRSAAPRPSASNEAAEGVLPEIPALPTHSTRPARPTAGPATSRPAEPWSAPASAGGTLSGVGLAPSPPSVSRASATHGAWEPPLEPAADYAPIVGLGVVGLVAILGTGLLMQLAHRPEGWPLAQFVLGPASSATLVLHAGFALVAVGLGLTLCRRGVLHWRGDLAGGHPSAIVNAVIASGAFFSAIELASAVS